MEQARRRLGPRYARCHVVEAGTTGGLRFRDGPMIAPIVAEGAPAYHVLRCASPGGRIVVSVPVKAGWMNDGVSYPQAINTDHCRNVRSYAAWQCSRK